MNLEATYDAIEAARVKAESEAMPRAERALAARYSAAAAAYARDGKDAALAAAGSEEEAEALVAFVWTSAAPAFARAAYDAVSAMKRDAPPASAWVRRALDFLKGRAARAMARSIASTTAEGVARFIAAGIEAGEGVAEIAARIRRDGLLASRVRAVTIVRTEVIAASSWASQAGANQAAEDLGLTLDKVWLSTSDARTRDTHRAMGGQRRPIGEPYSVGGQAAMHPGDVALPAAERIRCRCAEYYLPSAKKSAPVSWRDERDAAIRAAYPALRAKYGKEGAIGQIADDVTASGRPISARQVKRVIEERTRR